MIHVNVPYSMLLERVDFAIKNGIHPEIYFSAEDLDTCREKEAMDLAETLRRNGLHVSLHGPFMDLSPGGVDRRVKAVTMDRFSRTIELALIFRPKTVVFHAGYERWKFDGDVDQWLKSSLHTWRPLLRRAEEATLTLVMENVFEESPDPLCKLFETIDSPYFRFCFDTGHYHAFSFGRVPLHRWFEALGRYLVEVHLHDNHREMDEHLPVGEGNFDFDHFFRLLSQYGLRPLYTIEPHKEEHLWRGLEAVKRYIHRAPNYE